MIGHSPSGSFSTGGLGAGHDIPNGHQAAGGDDHGFHKSTSINSLRQEVSFWVGPFLNATVFTASSLPGVGSEQRWLSTHFSIGWGCSWLLSKTPWGGGGAEGGSQRSGIESLLPFQGATSTHCREGPAGLMSSRFPKLHYRYPLLFHSLIFRGADVVHNLLGFSTPFSIS